MFQQLKNKFCNTQHMRIVPIPLCSKTLITYFVGISFCTFLYYQFLRGKYQVFAPVKEPPPLDFWTLIIHKIILSKSIIPTVSNNEKYLSVPRGGFSNYFMKNIVFNQLYCSMSATLEIAYDLKNRFIVMYYLFSSQTTDCKNNLYFRMNIFWSNYLKKIELQ